MAAVVVLQQLQLCTNCNHKRSTTHSQNFPVYTYDNIIIQYSLRISHRSANIAIRYIIIHTLQAETHSHYQ